MRPYNGAEGVPPMPARQLPNEARDVATINALVTPDAGTDSSAFLDHCHPGSAWMVRIRTAEVTASLVQKSPLGGFDERICCCLKLRLDKPVPVEPGLRFGLAPADDPALSATGVIRPWGS